jgi:flagellar hook-length control protein FliK
MYTLINSSAVSPSGGDGRADGLMPWAPRMPQDRFADIPVLADADEEARSDSNADGEDDLDANVQREQDTINARKCEQAAAQSSHTATAAIASDIPRELPVQTRSGAGKGDSTSTKSSTKAGRGSMTEESPGIDQKNKSPLAGRLGKNGQYAQSAGSAGDKTGGFGMLVAVPSTPKGNPTASGRTFDGASQKALSGKQSPALAASSGSEATLRGLGSENQSGAGPKRGGVSGNLNPAMEALLSRGKETQPGAHKNGASAPTGSWAAFAGRPTAAGAHTSVGTGVYGSVDAGMSESVSRSVGEQILDSLRACMAQGDGQVLIRLQPPELGMVLVRFREQGQHLDGALKVERTDTRREIEQILPEVVRNLQDAGIGIRRLDLTGSDSPGQDPGKGQPQQDGWSGHGDAGQDRDSLWTAATPWPRAVADSLVDSPQVPDIQGSTTAPQGRIDMLL